MKHRIRMEWYLGTIILLIILFGSFSLINKSVKQECPSDKVADAYGLRYFKDGWYFVENPTTCSELGEYDIINVERNGKYAPIIKSWSINKHRCNFKEDDNVYVRY